MHPTEPNYSKDEFARRGDRIYERSVEPHLSAEDDGKFVAIDVGSGAYAIDADERKASDLLRARKPQAQIWLRRVGSRYVRRFGGHARSAA
ncbi:MAG: hypothetical protein ACR2GR_11055 [Rhodothermales bacterium]